MAERSGKTAKVTITLWYDDEAGDIHLIVPNHRFSTVNGNPESIRGNPHLFNKFAKVLRDEGKPHPPIIEDWKTAR